MASNCAHPDSRCHPGREPRVRPATPADAPAIHALVDAIFHEYGFALALDGVDAHLRDPGDYFRSRGGECWLLDRGGEIVGTVAVLPHDDYSAELKALYIHPSIRHRGWGAKLTTLVMNHAKRLGKHRLNLWSDTRFTDAHRLYARLGFTQSGERDLNDAYQSREYGFFIDLGG